MKFEINLIEFIKKYEGLSKTESKLLNEVFTPQALIEEMLDTLPNSVWSNKDLKWLDASVGIGNFPAAILSRLMKGLEEIIPNEYKRRKHILENMLYMGDISSKNLFLLYYLFDQNNEFKLNVFRGDFLSDKFDKHMKEVWELDAFDLVVGNPPYSNYNATGDNKLYLYFSKKSINILVDKGYLLYITPKNIINYILLCDKNRNYFNKFYQIEYLAIDTPIKYFNGIGSTFVYFLLYKIDYYKKTHLKYLKNNEEIKLNILFNIGECIPNKLSSLDISIINKIKSKGTSFIFKKMKINNKEFRIRKKQFDDGLVSIIKNDIYKYPVIDGINKSTIFPGKVYYMKEPNFDNIKKIIINGSGYLCPSYDESGIYFLSDNISYIEVNNESEYKSFLDIYKSKILNYWLNQFRLNGFSDAINMKKFPSIDLSKSWTDKELYEYFNLTQEEIQLIEDTMSITKNKKPKIIV